MAQSTGAGNTIADAAKREADAYRGDNPRPLGGYAMVLLVAGTFSALAGADFLQLAYAKAQQLSQH